MTVYNIALPILYACVYAFKYILCFAADNSIWTPTTGGGLQPGSRRGVPQSSRPSSSTAHTITIRHCKFIPTIYANLYRVYHAGGSSEQPVCRANPFLSPETIYYITLILHIMQRIIIYYASAAADEWVVVCA